MSATSDTIIALEKKFWQSMVDGDADTAISMLSEPSLMVTPMGATKFDHAFYRKMAEEGPVVIQSFELSNVECVCPNDSTAVVTYHVKQKIAQRGQKNGEIQEMNDTTTWIKKDNRWQCVMHTETPAEPATAQRH
jgi:hypothetical protein